MSDDKLTIRKKKSTVDETTKKPFYQSVWWVVFWCLLIWPVGILMILWYVTNIQTDSLPRTMLIKDENSIN